MVSFDQAGGIHADFAVPFVHRLYYAFDLWRNGGGVLTTLLEPGVPGQPARTMVFIDSGVAAAWPGLTSQIGAWARSHALRVALVGPVRILPGGEPCKNDRRVFDDVLAAMGEARLCRRSYVVAIGGGAVLDLVGFAAAVAHRGVRLVRLPTTTLAQADAGVGVKNGINLFGRKNFAGTFAVPWAVINDESFLQTLDDRDWRSGFAEAVKVALLKDPAFFADLARDARRIAARDLATARPHLRRSAELHLRHIAQGGDPFEMRQARPLDFGHWSAHRLEEMTGFAVRHGEAVALGIALDCAYARLAGLLSSDDELAVFRCLGELGFVLWHPALADVESLLEGLESFREHLGGELTITLLRGVGRPVDVHDVDRTLMARAVEGLYTRHRVQPPAGPIVSSAPATENVS